MQKIEKKTGIAHFNLTNTAIKMNKREIVDFIKDQFVVKGDLESASLDELEQHLNSVVREREIAVGDHHDLPDDEDYETAQEYLRTIKKMKRNCSRRQPEQT